MREPPPCAGRRVAEVELVQVAVQVCRADAVIPPVHAALEDREVVLHRVRMERASHVRPSPCTNCGHEGPDPWCAAGDRSCGRFLARGTRPRASARSGRRVSAPTGRRGFGAPEQGRGCPGEAAPRQRRGLGDPQRLDRSRRNGAKTGTNRVPRGARARRARSSWNLVKSCGSETVGVGR